MEANGHRWKMFPRMLFILTLGYCNFTEHPKEPCPLCDNIHEVNPAFTLMFSGFFFSTPGCTSQLCIHLLLPP